MTTLKTTVQAPMAEVIRRLRTAGEKATAQIGSCTTGGDTDEFVCRVNYFNGYAIVRGRCSDQGQTMIVADFYSGFDTISPATALSIVLLLCILGGYLQIFIRWLPIYWVIGPVAIWFVVSGILSFVSKRRLRRLLSEALIGQAGRGPESNP